MRNIKTGVIVLLTISCLYACDPCKNLDCVTSNYYFNFNIKNVAGTDLVFGAGSIYDKELFRFYSVQSPDTTFYTYTASAYTGDSTLQAYFFPEANPIYIQLSNGDVDTLSVTWQTKDTRCCGVITEIKTVRLNAGTEIPVTTHSVDFIK